MTRAENLSLPLLYYQYSHTAYHIRAESFIRYEKLEEVKS